MSQIERHICKNCGRSFLTRDVRKEFCNCKCSEYFNDGVMLKPEELEEIARQDYPPKVCVWCGKKFFKIGRRSKREWERRRFCSTKCKAEYYTESTIIKQE